MSTVEEPRFTVLRNDVGRYGLHPVGRDVPPGWVPAGFTGTEAECVQHVDEVSDQPIRED